MRITLDTNVFISGIFWKGNPRKVIEAAQNKKFELVTSIECIYELNKVLSEFKEEIGIDLVEFWTNFTLFNSLIVLPQIRFYEIKDDPQDNKFLDAAVAGKANFIISGDRHLLNLKEFKGIKILTPKEFLQYI